MRILEGALLILGPMKSIADDKIILSLIVALTLIVVADLVAATIVSVYADRVPQVLGDVAKVGTGALGGLAAGIAMAIKLPRE